MSSIANKLVLDFILYEKEEWPNSALMKFKTTEILPEIFPGQFVQVKVEDSPETYLRRPLSVNFIDRENSCLWLLVQKVGPGTRKLAALALDSKVNMILPLGNSFSLPEPKKESGIQNIVLIGGGIGTAPLLFLG
ncbi:MAG: dihydroorotate dehydrogenase electron transfer subunit, partial [Bacteroidales bacterium]